MLPPLFYRRGYDRFDRVDPLDRLPERVVFHVGVVGLVLAVFLPIVFWGVEAARLTHDWYMLIELGFGVFYLAPLVVLLRKSSSFLHLALWVVPGLLLELVVEAYQLRHPEFARPWVYQGFMVDMPRPLTFLVSWTVDGFVAGPLALWLSRIAASWVLGRRDAAAADDEVAPHPLERAPTTAAPVTQRDYDALFQTRWLERAIPRPRRGAIFYGLMLIGGLYLAYLVFISVALVGHEGWGAAVDDVLGQTFINPAMAINTFIKLSIMVALLFAAAYNARLRFHTALVLIVGHSVSTVASLALYGASPGDPWRDFLLMSAAVDGVFVAFFAVVLYTARDHAGDYRKPPDFPAFYSVPQRLARMTFYFLGAFFVAGFLLVFASHAFMAPDSGFGAVYGSPGPQVSNSLTKYATLATLAFMLATREALREKLMGIITMSGFVAVLLGAGFLIVGDAFGSVAVPVPGDGLALAAAAPAAGLIVPMPDPARTTTVAVDWYFMLLVMANVLMLTLVFVTHKLLWTVEYTITSLGPTAARCVMSLHDAFYGAVSVRVPPADAQESRAPLPPVPRDAPAPHEDHAAALRAVDRYLGDMRGRKRGLLNAPFALLDAALPLLWLRPPLSVMSRDERRYFLRRHVLRPPDERMRAFLPELAELTMTLGMGVHTLVTMGHYELRQSWAETGYVPPDARERLQADHVDGRPPRMAAAPLPTGPDDARNYRRPSPPDAPRLIAPRVLTPLGDPALPREVDYLVVGSGAGGAVMAYRLAQATGGRARVLVVERGERLSPLQDMTDREMEMVGRLYKDSGIQQSRKMDLLFMQGECVGGSTVINNGVCCTLQPHVQQRFEAAGVDGAALWEEYRQIGRDLEIVALGADDPDGLADGRLGLAAMNTRVEARFQAGVSGYNAAVDAFNAGVPEEERRPHITPFTAHANFRAPLGTGLGAFGNHHLRKRSMLETYIPWAEGLGAQVVSETSAVRFHTDPREPGRATRVTLRRTDGALHDVTVAKAVIVAAGTIASSHFLMRSDVGGDVGRFLSCNFALPLTAVYPDPLDAVDGLQIAYAATDGGYTAFETFANPPAAAAMELPYFFDDHARGMTRYRHMLNLSALVGSEPRGVVRLKADMLNGRAVTWSLGRLDQRRVGDALASLVELARHSGAQTVYLSSLPGIAIDAQKDAANLAAALRSFPFRMQDFRMFTSHPFGGNVMAPDGHPGVVDPTFRVRGYDNVYVADASLFPCSTVVNPQWTVMALAALASRSVLAHSP
ncbi:MAG: GMC family oxidoreductase [Deltaproteobacteria bacterium]|nr:MAG: GMC family oxidoreductase [Deltaproteobacteria bacterium]